MMQAEIFLTSFLVLDFNSITMLILHLQILISVLPSANKMTLLFSTKIFGTFSVPILSAQNETWIACQSPTLPS